MRRYVAISWLAMHFVSGTLCAQFGGKPVAVVNGEAIPRSELDAVMKLRPKAVTPLTAAQERTIADQIVNIMVEDALLRQFLARSVPAANAADVDKQYAALIEGLKAQKRTIADYCQETMQTEKQVRGNLETMLRWNAYMAQHVNDGELNKYYAENKDFFDRVTVKCKHIVFRMPLEAPSAERAEATKKLRELREQIVAGKLTFAEAAQKYSHCPSAPKGGELGYIYRKWMVEEPFAKAAFALKVNEMSDIVTTDFGLHLILVTDRKPPEPSEFSKVKEDVRECCAEEMRQKLLIDLRKSAKIEINLP